MSRVALYELVCLLGIIACTRKGTPATDASARVIDPSDSTWYVPPGGCAGHNAYVAPAETLRIAGFLGDTAKDLNAREAAFARVVPGGWAGFWREGDRLAIALVDTSRRVDAVHALYAHGYRANGDLMKARPQPVRWDFAQLDDWFNVIVPQAFKHSVLTGAGIDVVRNRIHLDTDVSQRPALRALLASFGVPCYIVGIDRGRRPRFPQGVVTCNHERYSRRASF